MRIKKNGKVINLTESDIKKLSKSLLKEQDKGGEQDIIALMNGKHGMPPLEERIDFLEEVTGNHQYEIQLLKNKLREELDIDIGR